MAADLPAASAGYRHPLAPLHAPGTIRLRCQAVLAAVEDGVSPYWKLERSALPALAARVARLTRERFPEGAVPPHSRWRHFEAGGVDRLARLDALLAGRSAHERARAHFDLALLSVLLDAGAGAQWRYTEPGEGPASGRLFARSEGLGVASFQAFVEGRFSTRPEDPLRVDAAALLRIDAAALGKVFQVTPINPMVGLEGRAGLLVRLGQVLQEQAALHPGREARPAVFFDRLLAGAVQGADGRQQVSAVALLQDLLVLLAPIWTSGSRVQGLPAGDVWPHPWAGAATPQGPDTTTSGWVPFHKLSQWLCYSLLEPLQWAGLQVLEQDQLTGLPEYRNGGLLMDGGALQLRDPRLSTRVWRPGDPLVIEWRACTLALLDELAALVRTELGLNAEQLPLAAVLEGGTWAAGREIARELREDGAPPLRLESDGTVF